MSKNIKEKLEKQLELLFELSRKTDDVAMVCQLTAEMCKLANMLVLLG